VRDGLSQDRLERDLQQSGVADDGGGGGFAPTARAGAAGAR
jgi:hypothetical protein